MIVGIFPSPKARVPVSIQQHCYNFAPVQITRSETLIKRILFAMALACLCIATATAQEEAPTRTILYVGHLLDVKSGKTLTNQQIVIEGEKIVSVGPSAGPGAKAGYNIIDLSKATVLPGLIDAHVHLTYSPDNFGYQSLGISIPREALTGARNAKVTLDAGFTTVRNVAADGYTDVALRDAINAGDVPGPRMLVSGPALGITGGHCDENLLPFEYHFSADGVADGVPAVQHKVRENIKYGADLIKICATGGVMSKGDDPHASQYTQEEMRAIVADAHRLGRKVAAHAHGAEGVRWASDAGVDSVEHGHLMDDASIATLKKNGTYLVPTLYLLDWNRDNMAKRNVPDYIQKKMVMVSAEAENNAKRAFQAGVKIALGTDAAVYPHGLNAHEFEVYTRLGMTPLQAIQSSLINGADLLGWSDKVGTIEPGKWADIIAVDGDPLTDIKTLQHVRFVMKGGTVYKNEYSR
jgi:imidazolonepropionase-like amidohydrolase